MSYLALSVSFEYFCYGSTAIRNMFTLIQCGAVVDPRRHDYLEQLLRAYSESAHLDANYMHTWIIITRDLTRRSYIRKGCYINERLL